ncbi:nicotinamide riboside kinase 1 isoform X2 [Podarcis muralis]|uniref:Nicotinamide riboside kinase 1 n=3 Tax=Podarcis muralis TaxID=64176 RepID=A0A670J505_PODMU|nr:nicotinamide riboside kinase 1 isoform X3 [Podarcis muralis]XP_028605015.1 nicotinamide riboside kinase 1 isoform X3 [Podarcis muralis]
MPCESNVLAPERCKPASCERAVEMLVIGLGGITNGGKTTLAKRLKKQLPNCTILSQDDYFKPESEVAVDDQGFLQYDVLDALHMEKMVADIRSWMTNLQDSALTRPLHDNQKGVKDTHVLIVEGFLLYNYKPLSDIWNKKYFITIPYEECKKRRSTRIYNPPDPPGYFDGHVWPMYLKHKREMEENETGIVYLDGTQSQEDLYSRLYNDIAQELEKSNDRGAIVHV